MKVYGHPMSTCTRKVLTTLAEKGHEAQFVLVDLMKGEHKQPAHVARQPFGVIPALEDDGLMLYESRAIIRYLDRKLPGTALTPTDLRAYALMEQFISVEQSYFSSAAMKVVMERFFKAQSGGTPDEARVAEGFKGAEKALGVIDPVLGKQQFLAGDSFSLADISWMPYMEYFAAVGGADLINQHKNVAAWWGRVSSRPSWKKVTGK